MQETLFTKQSRLLSISIRLGVSLALGILTVLLPIGLVPVASPSLAPAGPLGPGDLDTTFGSGGIVTTSIGPFHDYAYAVAIQPDGKIVVAGSTGNGSDGDFALARYTVSGTLDTTFGSGGVVITPIGTGDPWWDGALGVAIQPDGKIVAVGYADNGSRRNFALARYTISGTLDTTFGSGGIVTTQIGNGGLGWDHANGVALQPDGKIVVVGTASNVAGFDFALARYTVSGTLDTTFGSGGIVTTPISTSGDFAYCVAVQPDGKIVAAGYASVDLAVVRYTTSGTLDTTFGSGGIVTTPIGSGISRANGVALQPDGKIVAAGSAENGGANDFALARYTISGTLDTTFGSGGVVTTPIGPGNEWAYGVVIQRDGKIVAAGSAYNGSNNDFALARYAVSGMLDTTFGSGGIVTTQIGPSHDYAQGIALQRDGKIVAVGYASNGSVNDLALVRYHAGYVVYLPVVFRNL